MILTSLRELMKVSASQQITETFTVEPRRESVTVRVVAIHVYQNERE